MPRSCTGSTAVTDRPPCQPAEAGAWFAGRLPAGWLAGVPTVVVDRDEILVTLPLAGPTAEAGSAALSADEAAHLAFVDGFRERTRAERMAVAAEAHHRWRRQVSWAARSGPVEVRFTTAAVPVMTRLRIDERVVLDTLVDAGVARSRSEALAWCVRLVREHEGDWIVRLRDAMAAVEAVRAEGPRPSA